MIEWNALNKIISFKVLIRPLKGLHLLIDKIHSIQFFSHGAI